MPGPLPSPPGLALPAGFRLRERLGRGGGADVFRAWDEARGREVALKVLRDPGGIQGPERLRREARLLADLDHPNLVRVLEVLETPEAPVLVLELLRGATLEVPPPSPLEVLLDAAAGLAELHRRGLVHRDVKPGNIFRTEDGRVVLLDLGLARGPDCTPLTAPDQVLGTLAFLAPEVLAGGEATPAADWYGWGASLFWCLEGRPPYAEEVLRKLAAGQPAPPPVMRRCNPRDPGPRLAFACLHALPECRPLGLGEIRRRLEGAGPVAATRPMGPG